MVALFRLLVLARTATGPPPKRLATIRAAPRASLAKTLSADRLLRPRQRWRASREVAVRIRSRGIDHELLDEILGVGSQEPLWMPGDRLPSSDRCPAEEQRDGANLSAGDQHTRGNHRDPVPAGRQCDESLGGGAVEEHARPDVRDLAGGMEPFTRAEAAAQWQERLVCQLGDIKGGAAVQAVVPGQYRQQVYRVEQSTAKALVTF